MDIATFIVLAHVCAPNVDVSTARAVATVESGLNPYAIGVVNGSLERQPRNIKEAVATVKMLRRENWNFSIGISQINIHNIDRLGLSIEAAFNVCTNLRAMQLILSECFDRARMSEGSEQRSLKMAFSCYYSNNFETGFREGYVGRVVKAAKQQRNE